MNYVNYVDNVIRAVVYAVILISLILIFGSDMLTILRKKTEKTLNIIKLQRDHNALYSYVERLVNIVHNTKSASYVYSYFGSSITLFFITAFVLKNNPLYFYNLVFTVIIALLPFGYLYMKSIAIQVQSSFEGEKLLAELLNQYKINYFNMVEALDKTVKNIKDAPHIQKKLFMLSIEMKQCMNDEQLQCILNEFSFNINTEWAKMLSNNIYLAISDGVNVTVSLNDILKELRYAKDNMEREKRLNIEGFAIIKYLIPFMYVGSILVAVKYFSFTIDKFIYYQFKTATGFKFFIIICILFIVNVTIMYLYKRRKFDF